MTLVLVVDDVPAMRDQYAYDLQRVGGYQTLEAAGGEEALELVAREPVDCVILDLEMPGMDGFAVLRALDEREHRVPVIVYTGTGDFDRCVQAVRLGADAFIDKAEPMERVVHEIERALDKRRLVSEVQALRARLDPESGLIGTSSAMQSLRETIARVSAIPSPVMVTGESGTGKELVARELHRLGPGPKLPFNAINCAALPENLIESELFGHERGAFTGAHQMRKGAFEITGQGTLLLDEVGELPGPAQAKLLRVLEEREVSRVGGSRTIPVAARVVAATNRDLEAEVDAGRFRRDLFFRLNVHVVPVPPLRDRLSDVPDLVGHFLKVICARFGVRLKTLDPDALPVLMAYQWRKNNVRELRNAVERMVIAGDAAEIRRADVPREISDAVEGKEQLSETKHSFQEQKAEAERQIVLRSLEANDWHITRTAKELGLSDHSSLLKIMRRHGISHRK